MKIVFVFQKNNLEFIYEGQLYSLNNLGYKEKDDFVSKKVDSIKVIE